MGDRGGIDSDALALLMGRYRVLRFSSRSNRYNVINNYLHKVGDNDGSSGYYKRRAECVLQLEKYMIDDVWMRAVEGIIVDHLYA